MSDGVAMKAKTIRIVLAKKVGVWIKSIDDESLRKSVARDALVTGGAIASMLLGEDVSDYDIYLKTPETAKRLAEYYVNKMGAQATVKVTGGGRVQVYIKSSGATGDTATDGTDYEFFEANPDDGAAERYLSFLKPDRKKSDDEGKYTPRFLTSNAISLSDDVQIVLRFTGPADEIHKNYDYVHCTCCYDFAKRSLTLPPAALESLLARDLRYIGSLYPLCSLIRMRKFLARGWRITAGQVFKMCWDVAQLDLENTAVLEDQLTGVDMVYFAELVYLVEERQKEAGKIDRSYLMSLVDRLF